MSIQFLTNEQLYEKVIKTISGATSFVWIGTADIKDLHVHHRGTVESFLSTLNRLIKKKVAVRLLHAKQPGMNFNKSYEKYPLLQEAMEMQLCPRVHFKLVIIDGQFAYSGSANLTGAGLGIKSIHTRNFESGFTTTDRDIIDAVMTQFDEVWMGKFCTPCKRKAFCPDPII